MASVLSTALPSLVVKLFAALVQALDWQRAPAEPASTLAACPQRADSVMPTSLATTSTVARCSVRGLSTEAVVAMTTGSGPLRSAIGVAVHQVSWWSFHLFT